MTDFLIFGGTTEGRILTERLLCMEPLRLTVCVATEYAESLLPKHRNLTVRNGRLDSSEMQALLETQDYDCVVDATHPYAVEVTKNIRAATDAVRVPYLRLLRDTAGSGGFTAVSGIQEAVGYLNRTQGDILITTGSKEIAQYQGINGFQERVFVRVLPTLSSIQSCIDAGVPHSHIIAMQGPFSQELNLAVIRQHQIKCLVTKASGSTGGFEEKIGAAKTAGIQILVLQKQAEESGKNMDEMIDYLKNAFTLRQNMKNLETNCINLAKYFPLFISLAGKHVLFIGAGKVARRRIHTLSSFGCRISVIASSAGNLKIDYPELDCIPRKYQQGDCAGADLVLAATNQPDVNAQVVTECRSLGIPVNSADCKEWCDFYFPALIEDGSFVVGVTASGTDHQKVKRIAAKIREIVQDDANLSGQGQ